MDILYWFGIGNLVLLLIAAIIFGLPSTKGWAAEKTVRGILKTLPRDKYFTLNDVYFRGKRWSCQIDHLVISPFGIFCIETKNYLGMISGDYHDKYLQRKVLGMKYKTYSPIHQNYRHLQRLVETFPLIRSNSKALHSIVCFMPGGKPKIEGSGAATICMIPEVKKEILKYDNQVLSQNDCEKIASEVRKASLRHN